MKEKLLIFILLLAVVLRLVGIYPGYHSNHADEVNFQSQTVNIIKTGSLEELRFEYPPLPAYINFLTSKFFFIPISWIKFYINSSKEVLDGTLSLRPTELTYNKLFQDQILGEREINVLFWIRTVTAVFGVGVVFLIYLIGINLFNKRVGLISAFLVAINYRQVLNSHFGLPDIYNAFFLLLAFFMVIKVWKNPSFKNYFIAAFFCGLSFSTKYQFFAFIPFIIIHLDRIFQEKTLKKKLRVVFEPSIFIVPFVILLVFLILNPYFFIHFEKAKEELTYAALKYRFGKNFLDFYPLSYLYHYGIGPVTSILVFLGLPILFLKNFKKGLLISSLIFIFFYYMLYATGGGFYTRNFIAITPFLLMISALFFDEVLKIKMKYLGYFIVFIFIVFASIENLTKDFVVLANYSKPWNQNQIFEWTKNNIPKGMTIAAHSSVPLPDYYFKRVDFDTYPAFSIEEFKEEGAQYAIANFEWATNDFYWWMTQNSKNSLKYWNKPVYFLSQSYKAMAILEMEDLGIISFVKPGFAPEANFLVAKIPDYKVENKDLLVHYTFDKDVEGWNKYGENLVWENGSLIINKDGVGDPYVRWESPKILLQKRNFEIDFKIKTSEDNDKREGFLYMIFYKDNKELGVRLSKRNDIYNKWVDDSFVAEAPDGANYMQIGFQVYNPALAKVSLNDVKVYTVNVRNLNSEGVKHINLDENVLFPISHGNL